MCFFVYGFENMCVCVSSAATAFASWGKGICKEFKFTYECLQRCQGVDSNARGLSSEVK